MNFRRNENKMNYQEEKALTKEKEGNVNYKEDFEALHYGGFTKEDYQRLAFVRWLVATGRLSDHIA